MKLEFSHSGRQFFFVTLALEGRSKVLSRLGEMGDALVLSREGEIVVDYLKAVHSVWPSVTISNRVIMPDHIHFLMIVNYDRARDFNPLWASFMLMEAIEEAWGRTGRTDGGLPPPEPPEEVVERFLLVVSRGRLVAREIISLMKERGLSREEALVELSREGRFTAGRDFGALSREGRFTAGRDFGALSREGEFVGGRDFGVLSREGELIGGLGGRESPVRSALRFERRVNIELSFDSRQLKTIRRYIKLNPARAIWKASHPDRFIRFANIRHAVLDPNRVWDAMGNVTLLASPFLFHMRLTLKKTLAEHEAAICEIVEKAKRGMVIVSGFISPGEVEALRRLKATPHTRFIKLLPCALPPRYDPSAEDSRELAADRLLILSGFRNTRHISVLAMKRDKAQSHLFRANCLAMNDIAADLCSRAQTL